MQMDADEHAQINTSGHETRDGNDDTSGHEIRERTRCVWVCLDLCYGKHTSVPAWPARNQRSKFAGFRCTLIKMLSYLSREL